MKSDKLALEVKKLRASDIELEAIAKMKKISLRKVKYLLYERDNERVKGLRRSRDN